MAPSVQGNKRKEIGTDIHGNEEAFSEDEFETGIFDGTLSQGEDEESESGPEDEDEESGARSVEEIDSEDLDLEDEEIQSARLDSGPKKLAAGFVKKGTNTCDSSQRPDIDSTERINAPERDRTNKIEERRDKLPDSKPNYRVTKDANGNPRYIYDEIDPVYDSDDSDAPAHTNTIGSIPLSFYDSYPHIGYDINGKKIMRPAQGEALDALLETVDLPKGWTGLTDPATGKPLKLSQDELEVLKKIHMNEIPEDGYDPYPLMIEYFTSITEIMPLSAAPEPKRRFIPSKHEAKRVMKIVRAIREGRILPYKLPPTEDEADSDVVRYDIWANEKSRSNHPMNIPAPKLPPPGYDQSYNPPPEYLPSRAEQKAWEEADEEDRTEYLPTQYDALRKVPGYDKFVKERFERSLDLYLAPRVRRSKLNIDPESLLPKLPNPDELRPFPTTCATLFRGHKGRVRSLAIDPTGTWLASGGDDGTVRLWELLTGRQLWDVKLSTEEAVHVVRWRPSSENTILAAATGESVFLVVPPIINPDIETSSRELLEVGWAYTANRATSTTSNGTKKEVPAHWVRPSSHLQESGVLIHIQLRKPVKVISFHRRGDYFVTVSPEGQTSAIAIHTLSKHLTQIPFRRLKGMAQTAQFHPTKPVLFIATQRTIRSYDLVRQELEKILQPGARWISSLDIHSGGDNLIVGSYDRRLLWHDLDLSVRPYKTLRYHSKAIRAVKFHHGGLPLFADASDDGSLQIFHGKVVGDLMQNATIVPLKVLRGHQITGQLGVLDLDWHPSEPWCVSAGADGTCRLWM
ncbi:MAG: Ribosome biogenesis protein erb1 [Peltula sp. TS41687]|nr:MAG: Ribosome biogenesis protein erb1 [Peltula sp. TS41687]